MKLPRQGSPPARQCLPRDRRGKRVPSTLHHSPPLHPGGRRPAQTPPPRRRLSQGALPGERSLKLLGCQGGSHTTTLQPGRLAGPPSRPPARPLARVPRPGRGPRRTACSLAAPRRPVRRCTPRSRRRPGACRRGDETAAVTKSGLGGSEEASAGWEAGRRASGCSSSGSADRGGQSGPGRGGANQPAAPPSPAVTPPPGGHEHQLGPSAPCSPAPLARRGGRWRAVLTLTRPAKNKLLGPAPRSGYCSGPELRAAQSVGR